MDPVGGNFRAFAFLRDFRIGRIRVPAFGQKQFAVEQAVRVFTNIGHVNRDDAVIEFAGFAAVLFVDAGGPFAFLGVAGFVDDEDAVGSAEFAGDALLVEVERGRLIEAVVAEEKLQRSGVDSLGVGDGFEGFSLERAELTPRVAAEHRAAFAARAAAIKFGVVFFEFVSHLQQFRSSHAISFRNKRFDMTVIDQFQLLLQLTLYC